MDSECCCFTHLGVFKGHEEYYCICDERIIKHVVAKYVAWAGSKSPPNSSLIHRKSLTCSAFKPFRFSTPLPSSPQLW